MRQDSFFIARAIELAKRGEGFVEPNPCVGAVIVRERKIVGEGFHKLFGGPHAEIEALRKAGARARGATLYVSLEPCNHFGKTPPCTNAIIKAGIRRVVAAARDPNLVVNGFAELRKKGIEVRSGVLENEAHEMNRAFFKFHKTGLPFVACKWAMSLDGKIATRTGDSKWITSEKARNFAREIRAKFQGVVVGINTVLADNPKLTCSKKNFARIVLDSFARTPLNSYLVRTARKRPVCIVTSGNAPVSRIEALASRGCKIVQCEIMSASESLRQLAKRGFIKLLVEGGGETHGSLFDEVLVDEIFAFIAPKIIGGRGAVGAVSGIGAAKMMQALKVRNFVAKSVGSDLLIHAVI